MSYRNLEEIVHLSYSSKPKYSELMPGVPEDYKHIKTLGDLLKLNYKHVKIEEQLRGNLIIKLKRGEFPYPGIIGYDEDVIPAIDRAILSGHDILLIGQIGQAKTKIAESIAGNLLSLIPVIRGSVTNDIPTYIPEAELLALLTDAESMHFSPDFSVSKECEDAIRNNKLDTRIDWIEGAERYRYILATPDISVKDLVGQIDAIKIAKKGVELYSIESYSPGQLLQARHGILCIDELPVLDPRKQVALLSVLQEGKFTTGAYPIVFRPDTKIITTANPIDYTHSGKIIEPLFDRLRSHIDTHYPKTISDEMLIIAQEARIVSTSQVFLPIFILKTLANVTHLAREHHDINHDKGVSVRMAVHSLETWIAEAERTRSILNPVNSVPRFCDIDSIYQSSKFELSELEDSRENRKNILKSIIENAIKNVSLGYVQRLSDDQLKRIGNEFAKNKQFLVSQLILGNKNDSLKGYQSQLAMFPALKQLVNESLHTMLEEQQHFVEVAKSLGIKPNCLSVDPHLNGEFTASAIEVILEGLRWIDPPLLAKKENAYGAA